MKKVSNPKKLVSAVAGAFEKTSEVGKTAVESVQKGVISILNKTKEEQYQRRLKKYNSLFPEQFNSEDFNIPNMIVIVDEAVRRDVDVCEGAIGWLSNETGMEILHLYDEEVERSGIQFVPVVVCDAAYCVDPFDKKRFIKVDNLFSKAQEEKIAELKHIAYSLGAKRCTIEVSESDVEKKVNKKKASMDASFSTAKLMEGTGKSMSESSMSLNKKIQRKGQILAEFAGSSTPVVPELKWFQNDENIKWLIEMRCSSKSDNEIKSEHLELDGSSSSTISQKAAIAIDGAIGRMGLKGDSKKKSNMEKQVILELHSKLIFDIEF